MKLRNTLNWIDRMYGYFMDPNMEFVRMFVQEYNAEKLTDAMAYEVKKHFKSL